MGVRQFAQQLALLVLLLHRAAPFEYVSDNVSYAQGFEIAPNRPTGQAALTGCQVLAGTPPLPT